MSMTQPRLLVVLLNYRTAQMCMRAAEAAVTAMQGLDAELVIVDNDSGDGSFDELLAFCETRNWPHVRVLASGHNGGFGAGNNFGIRAGRADGNRADYVYILNSDAFPAPDAIHTLLNWCEDHPQSGIAGSYIHGTEGDAHLTAFRFPSIASEFEQAIRFGPVSRLLAHKRVPMDLPSRPQSVDWLAGASMLMRADMLDRIGLFDETYFLYFEETDLCLRAHRDGWDTVYHPGSRVAHVGSVSTGMKEWRRIPQYWLDSRLHYFTKNHGRVYVSLATTAHVTGGLFWRIRRVIQRKPPADPPQFLRDLVTHSLRSAVRPTPDKAPPVPNEPAKRLP